MPRTPLRVARREADATRGGSRHSDVRSELIFVGGYRRALQASLSSIPIYLIPLTIDRLAGHFQILLEGIVRNPELSVSDLPILTEAERHQLLVEWNTTRGDYPEESCIHELFDAQARRSSDKVAVIFNGNRLTYRELNLRANQLAHYLQKLGVGPETVVGICVERSLEMVTGLLGILKAGGAYLPIDPTYPKERLAFMLRDSQVPVLLTQSRLLAELPEFRRA